MRKKVRKEECCHRNLPETCLDCKIDTLRINPERAVMAGELLGVVNALLERICCLSQYIDEVESRLPVEYDPQCE
jgi:hypothetical protein